jgi:hypothetical protein
MKMRYDPGVIKQLTISFSLPLNWQEGAYNYR